MGVSHHGESEEAVAALRHDPLHIAADAERGISPQASRQIRARSNK